MRAFSYACPLPVTYKDGGHTIRGAITVNVTLHANFIALCFTEPELLLSEDCGKGDF